jgi:hypothetical protein
MKMEHSGGVKAMTDEQLEAAVEALQAMLAARDAGSQAMVIDAVPEPAALPAPRQAQRKRRKSDLGMGNVMGSDEDEGNS